MKQSKTPQFAGPKQTIPRRHKSPRFSACNFRGETPRLPNEIRIDFWVADEPFCGEKTSELGRNSRSSGRIRIIDYLGINNDTSPRRESTSAKLAYCRGSL